MKNLCKYEPNGKFNANCKGKLCLTGDTELKNYLFKGFGEVTASIFKPRRARIPRNTLSKRVSNYQTVSKTPKDYFKSSSWFRSFQFLFVAEFIISLLFRNQLYEQNFRFISVFAKLRAVLSVILDGFLLTVVITQRPHDLTTWKTVLPILIFFHESSANASEPETTKFGRKRFIGRGASSFPFKSASDFSPIKRNG